MPLPIVTLPRPVPLLRYRPSQDNVPATLEDRERLKQFLEGYVARVRPVPPLSFDEMRRHADEVLESLGWDQKYRDYV